MAQAARNLGNQVERSRRHQADHELTREVGEVRPIRQEPVWADSPNAKVESGRWRSAHGRPNGAYLFPAR